MPIDYPALKSELQNDPTALGYAQHITSGNDQALADVLNLSRAGITVSRVSIPTKDIWQAITITDMPSLGANPTNAQLSTERRHLAWLTGLASIPSIDLLNPDGTDTQVRANFVAIFTGGSGTLTRLNALRNRQGSRAEQLFGTGAAVSTTDVAKALRET